MGAREKLNSAYINGAIVAAAVAGFWLHSWLGFLIVFVTLLGLSICTGSIRSRRR